MIGRKLVAVGTEQTVWTSKEANKAMTTLLDCISTKRCQLSAVVGSCNSPRRPFWAATAQKGSSVVVLFSIADVAINGRGSRTAPRRDFLFRFPSAPLLDFYGTSKCAFFLIPDEEAESGGWGSWFSSVAAKAADIYTTTVAPTLEPALTTVSQTTGKIGSCISLSLAVL